MKYYITIVLLSISILFAISLHAQSYENKAYVSTLKFNIAQSIKLTQHIDGNCSNFDFATHQKPEKLTVNIGNEQYKVNDDVLYFYEELCTLSQIEACNLIKRHQEISHIFELCNKGNYLPNEMWCLPLSLTGMNAMYVGINSDAGIWALQYLPAVRYGIIADSCYDERFNIELNSFAAIQYLNHLHKVFGSWDIAVAAYTTGVAHVKKSLAEQGLSEAGTYYSTPVFNAFLASVLWIKNFGANLNPEVQHENQAFDTIIIARKIHFAQISEVMHLNIDSLKAINPSYVCEVIYGNVSHKKLFLPKGQANNYHLLEDSIAAYRDTIFFPVKKEILNSTPEQIQANVYGKDYETIVYTIVGGDNLGSIAEKFGVSVSDIKDWNNISGTTIYAGKKINIYKKKTASKTVQNPTPTVQNNVSKQNSIKNQNSISSTKDLVLLEKYTVKKGDSPYSISKKYPGVTADDILLWNQISNPSQIQIGQTLKIYKKK